MENKRTVLVSIVAVTVLALGIGLARAQEPQPPGGISIQAALGTAFTYQGQLKKGGNPISGTCDFQFSLWDSSSNPTGQIGTTQTKTGVTVSNGYFTIPDLDFGAGAFQGDARWLQIAVKCGGETSYTTLTPRQPMTAAPYALYARSAWSLTGNSGTTPGTNFLGTTDNQALEFRVNNGRILRLEPNNNLIGGHSFNSAGAGVVGATIGGGGSNTSPNSVTANYGTVGGGFSNTAGGLASTVGGGRSNTAGGEDVAIGGGAANNASGQAATIAGGNMNTASGYVATVSGGGNNRALSDGAAVGGGMNNRVVGSNSVIGGGAYNTISATVAVIGGGHSNLITGTASYGTIAGGYRITVTGQYAAVGGGRDNTASGYIAVIGGGYQNTAVISYTTIGGGHSNLITGTAAYGTIGGGESNTASSWHAVVGGGRHNTASGSWSTVSGGEWNTASGVDATVGGGNSNEASGNYATIAGGYNITITFAGQYAAVGGGSNNIASGQYATVGGGHQNTAGGSGAIVGGGTYNTASSLYSTVGGGTYNIASSYAATVGGGEHNTASGWDATVPGGSYNTAQGDYSFAAGRRAKAYNPGCFVWGDSTNADVPCNNDNRWVARASGGVYFYTNASLTTGSYLAAGGSSWNSVSNRALKENFQPVDTRQLLERLAAIPITTWNYKSQDPSIRHIGPMADDFNALVEGLGGEGREYINSLDANGVALAAIQGLYGLVQEKDARIAELEGRVAALEAQNAAQQAQIDALEARLSALEQRVGSAPATTNSLSVLWPALGGLAILGAVAYWRRKEGGQQ